MLYCEACRPKWVPYQRAGRTVGNCESCGLHTDCAGVHSSESFALGWFNMKNRSPSWVSTEPRSAAERKRTRMFSVKDRANARSETETLADAGDQRA
jgi:hypothetical protein